MKDLMKNENKLCKCLYQRLLLRTSEELPEGSKIFSWKDTLMALLLKCPQQRKQLCLLSLLCVPLPYLPRIHPCYTK
ncbi:hypothetical protein BYT27DRAFT_7286133, partial [Phlegmacium glaucopus]